MRCAADAEHHQFRSHVSDLLSTATVSSPVSQATTHLVHGEVSLRDLEGEEEGVAHGLPLLLYAPVAASQPLAAHHTLLYHFTRTFQRDHGKALTDTPVLSQSRSSVCFQPSIS